MPEKVNGSKRATVEYSGEAPLGRELGMPWDEESIFGDYEGGKVFDYDPWSAREIVKMLEKDGKAALVEQVLTQPVARLPWDLEPAKGDKGEAEFVRAALERPGSSGGMSVPLEFIIHQATSAFGLRKAYFEKVFKVSDRGDTAGKVVYDKIAFRPSSTCQMARDARTGAFRGFRQVPYAVAEAMPRGGNIDWINIPEKRAWVYIHGQHRDPMRGISSLEITYWAFQTKMKIRWLWMKFLEKQALPSLVVQGPETQAKQAAMKLLGLKNNGVAQIDGAVSWSKVDQAGNGSAMFLEALRFLDSEMANSIMAGFTNLTDSASDGRGSFALAKDASDFFLKSRQAAADELAQSISHYLVADLVKYNFGPEAEAPEFKFGQMVDADVADILTTFNTLVGSTANNLPGEFTYMLAEKVADYMDLDTDKLRAEFDKHAKEKEEQAKRMAQMQMEGHLVNAAAQKEAIKRGGMVGRAAGATTAAAKVMGKPGEQKPGEKKLSVEKDHGTVFEVPALPWHEDEDDDAIILAVEGGEFVDLDGNTVELASVKVGGSHQHVPGTAYNWRHGWKPLNVKTALKYRKKLAASKLQAEGKHVAEEPSWYQGLHPEKGTTVKVGASQKGSESKVSLKSASDIRKGWKVGDKGLEVESITEEGEYLKLKLKGVQKPAKVHKKSKIPVHSEESTIGIKDLQKNPISSGDAGGDKLPYSGKAEKSKVAQADLDEVVKSLKNLKVPSGEPKKDAKVPTPAPTTTLGAVTKAKKEYAEKGKPIHVYKMANGKFLTGPTVVDEAKLKALDIEHVGTYDGGWNPTPKFAKAKAQGEPLPKTLTNEFQNGAPDATDMILAGAAMSYLTASSKADEKAKSLGKPVGVYEIKKAAAQGGLKSHVVMEDPNAESKHKGKIKLAFVKGPDGTVYDSWDDVEAAKKADKLADTVIAPPLVLPGPGMYADGNALKQYLAKIQKEHPSSPKAKAMLKEYAKAEEAFKAKHGVEFDSGQVEDMPTSLLHSGAQLGGAHNSPFYEQAKAAGYEPVPFNESVTPDWKPAKTKKGAYVYSGGSYQMINAQLRKYKSPTGGSNDDVIAEMDKEFKAAPPLTKNIVTSRRMLGDGPFPGFPPPMTPGAVFVDYGYSSTSKDPGAWSGNVHMEVRIPAGTKVLDLNHTTGSQHSNEQEILLNRGTKYKVLADEKTNGTRRIVVEVIP